MALLDHSWFGNARELRNFVTGALLAAEGSVIDIEHINLHLSANASPRDLIASAPKVQDSAEPSNLADLERETILDMLRRLDGNRAKAAQLLGISPRTLYRKLRTYQAGENNAAEPFAACR
jgi:DNA-binding NtrC family response regulator